MNGNPRQPRLNKKNHLHNSRAKTLFLRRISPTFCFRCLLLIRVKETQLTSACITLSSPESEIFLNQLCQIILIVKILMCCFPWFFIIVQYFITFPQSIYYIMLKLFHGNNNETILHKIVIIWWIFLKEMRAFVPSRGSFTEIKVLLPVFTVFLKKNPILASSAKSGQLNTD